jgi:hypothetical protein
MRLVREYVYLYDVEVSACLADACQDYSCFCDVTFFFAVSVHIAHLRTKSRRFFFVCVHFRMKRTAIKFCVKLRKSYQNV